MHSAFAVLPVALMLSLAGCALMAESEREPAPAEAVSVTADVPSLSAESDLPSTRAAVLILPSASRTSPTHAAKPGAITGHPQEPAMLKTAEPTRGPAAGSAQSARSAAKEGVKEGTKESPKESVRAGSRSALPGPAWLKGCQHRQQQANVIMCDADALLVQPSDKVMVYVRDAKLSRKSAGSHGIALRESLPRLYRFFVLD